MNNGKLKVCWIQLATKNPVANALGYAVHSKFMMEHCQKIIDFDIDAKITVSIVPADHFIPISNKFNFLFTMWEFLDLPQCYIDGLNKADAIIVPSAFCRDLFRRYIKKPISVCWEGIEPEKFPFYQRKFPNLNAGERFRFLWIGAPNPRKGYPLILEAIKLIEQIPHWEIYIKTTASEKPKWNKYPLIFARRVKNIFKHKNKINMIKLFGQSLKRFFMPELSDKLKIFGKYKNIFFDTRKLPFDELTGLYNLAHCFLLPTFGEGWGLTLCEAMATGCPSIATNVTGIREFFSDDVGYTLKYEIKPADLRDYYKFETSGYIPDTKDFIEKMIYVFQHYNEALKKGEKASKRIHNKFTWEKSARRLDEIIRSTYANIG